ncbi:MAG: hypothetical protein COB67_13255 [SAR324 cluster bacterium]|uniref:Uncharacterized protein n=1 Tax=SAR324 cluster bacterium TaxID=2024889 RepID=A0A2A4SMW5_9DELT|nr:MAG: hypothetical protein COB67_13255 [SAR324 cluster bacterium]
MAIPKHDQIRLHALELLKDRDVMRLKDFEMPIAKQFDLSDDEREQLEIRKHLGVMSIRS